MSEELLQRIADRAHVAKSTVRFALEQHGIVLLGNNYTDAQIDDILRQCGLQAPIDRVKASFLKKLQTR